MNIFRSTFLVGGLVLSTLAVIGQTMKQGTIKMEVIDVTTTQAEMQQMIGAMKGSTQEIQFDQEKQHIKMAMMGGLMETNMYQDFSTKGMETYLDMMGQKIKMVITPEQAVEQEKASEELLGDNPIKYDKSDVKEILGHKCFKGTLATETNGQVLKMVFWLTNEIEVPQAFVQNMNSLKFEGTPLEIMMDMGQMTMTYQAVEVSKNLGPDFYKKPAGDYKQMSMEDLQKMGMGGQLGF